MNKNFIVLALVVFALLILGTGGYLFYKTSIDQTSKIQSPLQNSEPVNPPKNQEPAKPNEIAPALINQIPLKITSPSDGMVILTNNITVTGITSPNAEVSINELDLTANAKGNFSVKITLEEGENPLLVTAIDSEGNYAEQIILVSYLPD